MTVDELPLMLTVDEAAEVLRIGRNSAYAAVAEGAIPSVRIGRIIRIPRTGLAAIVHEHDGTATPPESPHHGAAEDRGHLLQPRGHGERDGR